MGKHRLKLSNLDKVLFPESGIIKAEVIQYYLQMAPYLLRHIKHRPLSFVRFPDGIHEESFYQKNRPNHTPQWIQSVRLGNERKINYIVATSEATLVWLANLACIEFHQMSVAHPDLDHPDHFVFDLDPPEDMSFKTIIDIAEKLKRELVRLGYTPFVKTSGKKGLHIYCPIHRRYDHDTIKGTLRKISDKFVLENTEITTTNIRKEARHGKCFIDIVRNSKSQTVICPYSLRSTKNASVSMPLTWNELPGLTSAAQFTIKDALATVQSDGDPWEGFGSHAAPLHDQVKPTIPAESLVTLKDYIEKRDFHNTPEPLPGEALQVDDAFVVHRHSASRLHYDLRLSENGILKSWAVPKGLPGAPGTKHLAIQTEDHPMEYLDFEGTIPKGEYGAGQIWVFARGNYRITKTKREGFYFKLQSPTIDQEFRIHRMKDNEWLLERVDPATFDMHKTQIAPMLCKQADKVPDGLDLGFEVKWDGIRVMIYIDGPEMLIRSRSGRDISAQFPEVVAARDRLNCTQAVLDGEIVVLTDDGKPDFKRSVSRLNKTGEQSIQTASVSNPAYCYLFDTPYLDGVHIGKVPLSTRQAWIADLVKSGGQFRVSESIGDGDALFAATAQMGLEGIIAKRLSSTYSPGKRSENWLKIKHRKTVTCQIIGYTAGKGDRAQTFGALHITSADSREPVYLGKVGSGFTDKMLTDLHTTLRELPVVDKPIDDKVEDERVTTWIGGNVFCEVEYASVTKNGTLREPVFLRLRPDFTP